jgi:TatD DNase family protein
MTELYIDVHTHGPMASNEVISVYNLMLNEKRDPIQGLFSAGLHPWFADQAPGDLSMQLSGLAKNPDFFGYGETGLDKACNLPFQLQQDIFKLHMEKATEKNKPLILHCVKSWNELMEMTSGCQVPMILHGYSGSLELTKQLRDKGFYFSIGKAVLDKRSKLHSSLKAMPLDSIFCETDEHALSIQAIYQGVGNALKIPENELMEKIYENFMRLRSMQHKGLQEYPV